jgi:hypothetical protein
LSSTWWYGMHQQRRCDWSPVNVFYFPSSFLSSHLDFLFGPFKNKIYPLVVVYFNFSLHSFVCYLFCLKCYLKFFFVHEHLVSFIYFIQFGYCFFNWFFLILFMIFFIQFYPWIFYFILISIFLFLFLSIS